MESQFDDMTLPFNVINGQVNIYSLLDTQPNLEFIPLTKESEDPSTSYETNSSFIFKESSPFDHQSSNQPIQSFQQQKNREIQYSQFVLKEKLSQNFSILSQATETHYHPHDLSNPQSTQFQNQQDNEVNDSKNVPKGMIKAFGHMVLNRSPNNIKILKRYFDAQGVEFKKYQQKMKRIRKMPSISITKIREMLLTEEFAETTRKIGNFFIRKRFLSHIFNSKMQKRHIHMKYIHRWLEIFRNPESFYSLK